MQCRIGGEMVVPKKEEARTMELVTSGASGDIHSPACSCPGTQIKVGGGYLKFLHCFLRKSHRRSTISDLHDAAAVHGNARRASVLAHRAAQQRHQGAGVACPRWLLCPRLELG